MAKKIRKSKPGKDGRTAIAPPGINEVVKCPKCDQDMTMRDLTKHSRKCWLEKRIRVRRSYRV